MKRPCPSPIDSPSYTSIYQHRSRAICERRSDITEFILGVILLNLGMSVRGTASPGAGERLPAALWWKLQYFLLFSVNFPPLPPPSLLYVQLVPSRRQRREGAPKTPLFYQLPQRLQRCQVCFWWTRIRKCFTRFVLLIWNAAAAESVSTSVCSSLYSKIISNDEGRMDHQPHLAQYEIIHAPNILLHIFPLSAFAPRNFNNCIIFYPFHVVYQGVKGFLVVKHGRK